MKTRQYTPFLRPSTASYIDGVYRSKNTGSLMKLRRMKLIGMLDCSKKPEEPFDCYRGLITLEGAIERKCSIEPCDLENNWEKIF